MNATVLAAARLALSPDWNAGRHLVDLFERFTGTIRWDDPTTLINAYERHNTQVRNTIPTHRLLEWNAKVGWLPICQATGKAVPPQPFPWINRREEWG